MKRAEMSGLFIMVLFACLAGVFAGISLDWRQWLDATSTTHRILFELRLPRLVFVFSAGASLAAVGAAYQILFYNPLAEPYLLGISSGAVLGIAVAESFFGILVPSLASQGIGLVCAGAVTVLLVILARSVLGNETDRIALFGLGVNFVLSSILFLLLSYRAQVVGGGTLRWLFGQIPWVSGTQAVSFAGITGIALGIMVAGSRTLDALAFGDGVARTMGFAPTKVRTAWLVLTSAMVAWLVSFTGIIGFVGLVVPHTVRLVYHPSTTRGLLARSLPLGGAFLVFSDAVSRSLLPPMEFPVGIVTTLIGGPLFLFLLWRK